MLEQCNNSEIVATPCRLQQVIAVDFDGVLCEDRYPKIGEPKEDMIKYFKQRKADGDKLILWTCRKGIYLNNAVAWCRKRGLEFDAVNENLPEYIEKYRGDTRKVFADIYVDDRAGSILENASCKDREENNLMRWAKEECKKLYEYSECDEYNRLCCESALNALSSLCNDGHSGFSIKLTKHILNDLIDLRPLTPITEENAEWHPRGFNDDSDYICYQSSRMSSLFKHVYPNGIVKYTDIDRQIGVDKNGLGYSSGIISDYIDTVYPIQMPYTPSSKPFKVYTEEFLVNPKLGDFDTKALLYMVKPDGSKFDIGYYFKERPLKGWKRITKLEYLIRKARRIK